MSNYTSSCFVRLLIVSLRKHDPSVRLRKLCELQALRGLHRLYDLSVSLGWAEGLSARGGQNCVQTLSARDHVGGASPVRGWHAVPPRLSLG